MRYAVWVARFLLGVPFVIFGLNTVFYAYGHAFIQPPAEMPKQAADFLRALGETHFMDHLRGISEFLSGAMILSGFLTPLGLAILAPVLVHIVLYHTFIDSTGLGFACFLMILELFLAYAYWPAFRGMFANPVHRWTK